MYKDVYAIMPVGKMIRVSMVARTTPRAVTKALKNTGFSNFIFKDIRNPPVSD